MRPTPSTTEADTPVLDYMSKEDRPRSTRAIWSCITSVTAIGVPFFAYFAIERTRPYFLVAAILVFISAPLFLASITLLVLAHLKGAHRLREILLAWLLLIAQISTWLFFVHDDMYHVGHGTPGGW